MKAEEKSVARELRRQGWSYNQILRRVPVSKGTLSLWLRDIELTDEQIHALQHDQGLRRTAGRERLIRNVRAKRDTRWAGFQAEAQQEYEELSRDPAFMFGLALYVGEGSKKQNNSLCIVNCDPRVVRQGIAFFQQIGAPHDKIICTIHLHPGLCVASAESYWREQTDLTSASFRKTVIAISSASGAKKGNLQQFGTCHVKVHSTWLCQKVYRWMDLALQGPLVNR